MNEITTSQFNTLLINNQNDSSVTLIYMGRESCPVCIELLPQIKQHFKENQLLNNGEKVTQYYFDSEKNKSEETK